MKTLNHNIMRFVKDDSLKELKNRLFKTFNSIEKMKIFGSVVRTEADNESDYDIKKIFCIHL
ncbi:MAG: nucleotidyltransferase domain-containing protein [Candidatus Magnetomorum sp.]|nr:nucleotidyltransferase domain-containing protein [Candidatus Magnetomorum sp.]